jgi:uncharacterized protein
MRSTRGLTLMLMSIMAASGTPAQRSAAPPAAAPVVASRVETDTIMMESRILGQARRAFVALPPSHARTTRRYPVILVLDGEANFTAATTVAGTLARLGHVPEAIVVGIPNADGDPRARVRDMTPPGLSVSGSSRAEGGDRFLDFIERELLPQMVERYRGGAPVILVGHSSGGVIATWAAATRAAFPVVLSIDAPIHLDDHWLAERLQERTRRPGGTPLRYVSMETRFGWDDEHWHALESAAPDDWTLHRERLAGESHESMVFLSLYQGLKFAFRDYSITGAPLPPRSTALGAFEHYRKIETEFGAELPPPTRVLRQLVEDLLTEGRVEPARRAAAWLLEGYGPRPEQAEIEAMIARVAALPPLAETVESLQAAPLPSLAEMTDYLGEWTGEAWLNDDARWTVHVRFRAENGTLVAEQYDRVLDGSLAWVGLEYVRVLPDGLEFGRMNGMRPMGMLVYRGVRDGNALAGTQGFRGIVLPLPTGHQPPRVHFRIVRQ